MPEAVVDLLEAIKVDHQHREAVWRGVRLETHSEPLEEEPAVWQPREVVRARLAPAVGKRAQLPKRIGGSTDGDHEREAGENDPDPNTVLRALIHNDPERAHEEQSRHDIRRPNRR